jgi:hypothetical protein
LALALQERGHRSIAVDLLCEDPGAGCSTYAEIVLEHVTSLDTPPVVVGHSLAGLTIPLVAAAHPVRQLVFLNALIARPGASLRETFYPDCSSEAPRRSLPVPGPALGTGRSAARHRDMTTLDNRRPEG